MAERHPTVERIDEILEKGEMFLAKALLGVQVMIIFSEVVCRYLLNSSLIWSEELARYLLVWIAFVGASIGLKRKGHFGVELLVMAFPRWARKFFAFVTLLVMFIFLGTVTVFGILMTVTADEVSTVMQMPMSYPYAAIPLGGLLMLFHLFAMVRREGLENFYLT
jgi:TRAP-type C4-dicarboxylate transport system permease small subunit